MKRSRTTKPKQARKQIGATLDVGLYRQMRASALLEGRTVAELLDDAMKLYLAKHKKKG